MGNRRSKLKNPKTPKLKRFNHGDRESHSIMEAKTPEPLSVDLEVGGSHPTTESNNPDPQHVSQGDRGSHPIMEPKRSEPQYVSQEVGGMHPIMVPNNPDLQYLAQEGRGSNPIIEHKSSENQFSIHGGVRGSNHFLGNLSGDINNISGDINKISGDINNVYGSKDDLFKRLRPDVVFDAFYNSRKRQEEHTVTCLPETRAKVLSEVRSWADKTNIPICWLSGPAGTGKTTVAHTIAKEYNNRGKLAATFFFWRKTGDRDKIHKLVPTLAYQIAKKNSSVKEQLEKELELEVPLSSIALQDQLEKVLILQPGINVKPVDFMLVVIDGLDECDNPELISELVDWLRSNTFPFRIFLTSRPEPHITNCFRFPLCDGSGDVHSLSLTDSKDDIRKYFTERLGKIQKEILSPQQLSDRPLISDIDLLVEKSEGLFIYAATAVRYIGGKGDPRKRLNDVIKIHKGLDPLYSQVLQEASEWDYFDIVMASLMYTRQRLLINELTKVLMTNDGLLTISVIRIALHGCHSLLVIPDDDVTKIRFHHASLRDFLTNNTRSGNLFCEPAKVHAQLMLGCLQRIKKARIAGGNALRYALTSWHFHACSFLCSTSTGEELQDLLNDDCKNLVDKIDKEWTESWIMEALRLTPLSYLKGDLSGRKKVNITN